MANRIPDYDLGTDDEDEDAAFRWDGTVDPAGSAEDGPLDSAATYLAACRRRRIQPDVTFRQRLGEARIGLQHHTLGPAQGHAIGEALVAEGSVESLDLRDNSLGDEGVAALASALERVEGLQFISLDENGVTGKALPALARAVAACSTLQSLSLAHNALGARCQSALASVVRSARAVTDLRLSHCDLGPACGAGLAEALAKRSSPLQRLDLQWNNLGPRGTRALAAAVEEGAAPALRALDLSFNGVDDSAPLAVASLLRHPSLTRLDLSSNRLGPASAEAVAAELPQTRALRSLRIGHNPLTTAGAFALCRALRDNASLTLLALEGVCAGDGEREALDLVDEAMESRSSLVRVVLAHPEHGESALLSVARVRRTASALAAPGPRPRPAPAGGRPATQGGVGTKGPESPRPAGKGRTATQGGRRKGKGGQRGRDGKRGTK